MKTITQPDAIGHETCNQTIEELLAVVASQQALLESTIASLNTANQTIATLNSLMALIPANSTAKRGRGRPTKVTTDAFLLETFNSTMKPAFVAANQFAKPTDRAVLNWYFEKEYARYGMSASRVRGKVFQGKLKRMKNRLGDARHPIVKLPIK